MEKCFVLFSLIRIFVASFSSCFHASDLRVERALNGRWGDLLVAILIINIRIMTTTTTTTKRRHASHPMSYYPDMDKELYTAEEAYELTMKDIKAIYDEKDAI